MNVWVVIDLESLRAWVYLNDGDAAKKKKKARLAKHSDVEHPAVYLRKLVLG